VRRAPIRDPEGRIVGVVSVSRDITERRRLEEQLRRAQRLEAAGRVAGHVADDFNNLLAPVVAFAELLKTELPDGHPGRRYCDMMLTAAQRMAEISHELLPLGRRGLIAARPVDLNEVVRQVEGELTDQLQPLSVETHLAADLLPVNGSQAQIHRVVANLVANACDAMERVGVLTLKTELYYVDRQFGRYNRVEMGEYVKLTVSDTGCGIPQPIRDKIFDAFFTTKYENKRRGAGLGLSVVQAIVDDHRGYLDLSTEPGKGTAFYVYLPVSRGEAGGLSLADIPLGNETILVADDDPTQREVADRLLGRLGYRVAAVSSGEEALTYLSDHQVDLLVLDMIMPRGIDGVETYRRAKQIRRDQKAIVLYGFAETSRVREAQELGVGICMPKPVRLEVLARVVRRELDRQ
jgi:nitrogen-specific signal transduction histidine kinase